MSTGLTLPVLPLSRARPWRSELGVALLVTLAILAIHMSAGFPTLAMSGGDNDSLLRLVEVRDLIDGQGWFDLQQYRMGPDGGFLMHWSRLVDTPIAAIIIVATKITGSAAMGETVALVAWPALLLLAAMALMLRVARLFAGEEALLPMAVLGGAALHFTGLFAPGAIDHHNFQLVLTLGVIGLLARPANIGGAMLAGVLAVAMLAIGMETAPYVAAAGLLVALAFAISGESSRSRAAGFGTGFALAGAIAFFGTVGPARWSVATCDAYSWPHAALAAIGGAGLSLTALSSWVSVTRNRRIAALAAIAAVAGGIAIAFFPECLGDPYAGLDPRLKDFWLSSVTEALPVWSILENKPAMAPGYYATPLIGLIWFAVAVWRRGSRAIDMLVGAFLATAFAVSLWQVRGSMFSIPLAAIPLSAWATEARAASRRDATSSATLKMAAAWLLSLNMAWSGGAKLAADLLGLRAAPRTELKAGACYDHADFAALASLHATTVLAVSNLGAPILRNTHHRALAGPYHRNVAGNLLVLDAFSGSAEAAKNIVRDNRVGLVAYCGGNDETGVLADRAPNGFMADLRDNRLPLWLHPVDASNGGPLKLFRVELHD